MQTLGLNNLKGFDQKPFDGIDFDIWITIDSDIIFTPANVIKLIESTNEHNVVSGIYRMTDLKNLATIIDVASTRGAFRAGEMATVGAMYNKLQAFITKVAPASTTPQAGTTGASVPQTPAGQ